MTKGQMKQVEEIRTRHNIRKQMRGGTWMQMTRNG